MTVAPDPSAPSKPNSGPEIISSALDALPTDALIARVNELSAAARPSWFGLLSYLAFVVVTLFGVEDADFFIPERQTDLPLVGVSIPTLTFFWIAPLLGTALFAYFHLHLIKLFEALGAAQRRGDAYQDQITPWLVSDFALAWGKASDRRRPMRGLAFATTLLLAYLAWPLIQGYFWYRSMPSHNEALTLLGCGLPLMISLYTARASWSFMLDQMRPIGHRARWSTPLARGFGAAAGAGIVSLGWLATEGSFEHYARSYFGYDGEIVMDLQRFEVVNPAEEHWWGHPSLNALLYPADLAGVDFVDTPLDWRDLDTAREAFRSAWCAGQGIAALACGPGAPWINLSEQQAAALQGARDAWCAQSLQNSDRLDCAAYFETLNDTFLQAWEIEWSDRSRRLTPRSLAQADLRNADLSEARLDGADLTEARLQGATLAEAQLQGADLSEAQLSGADLSEALLQEADLERTGLAEANLTDTHLEGADLNLANLQGARLHSARLQGANLTLTFLQGADLTLAHIDADTRLSLTQLAGAGLLDTNPATLTALRPFWDQIFFASPTLPGGHPPHWLQVDGQDSTADPLNAWTTWADTLEQAPLPAMIQEIIDQTGADDDDDGDDDD